MEGIIRLVMAMGGRNQFYRSISFHVIGCQSWAKKQKKKTTKKIQNDADRNLQDQNKHNCEFVAIS